MSEYGVCVMCMYVVDMVIYGVCVSQSVSQSFSQYELCGSWSISFPLALNKCVYFRFKKSEL